MAIEHITPNGSRYTIHYQELKAHYERFCAMIDKEFLEQLPHAVHLACAICWFKELDPDQTIGDTGIIHELIHLLAGIEMRELPRIREMFKKYLQLA